MSFKFSLKEHTSNSILFEMGEMGISWGILTWENSILEKGK